MSISNILYAVVCVIALAGLAYGNMNGYVPFVANAAAAAHAASNSLSHK